MENFTRNSFTSDDMSQFVELEHQVMAARAHGHVSCSWMNFLDSYMKLESLQEGVATYEANSDVAVTMRRAMFEVESVPLYYTRAPCNYQTAPRVKMFSPPHLTHCSSHLGCWFAMGQNVIFVQINATSLIHSSQLGWRNEMSNNPRLRGEKDFYEATFGFRIQDDAAAGSEECEITTRFNVEFHNPRVLDLDACCGTIATGRAQLLVQQHCGFVGCERDPNCKAEAKPSPMNSLPGSF